MMPNSDDTIYLSNFFRTFLFTTGIFHTKKLKRFATAYCIIYTTLIVLGALGSIIGLLNSPTYHHKIENMAQIVCHLYVLSLFWIIKGNENRLLQFLSKLRGDHPQFIGYESTLMTEYVFKNRIFKLLVIFSFFMLMILILPVVMVLLKFMDMRNRYIHILSSWYQCDPFGNNNFPVKYTCYTNIEGYMFFVLVYSAQLSCLLIEIAIYFPSFIFYACVYTNFESHVKVIIERLRHLETIDDDWRIDADRKDDIVFDEFLEIVKYQQYLARLVQQIVPFLNLISGSSLSVFCTVQLFAVFTVTTNEELKTNLMYKIKWLSVVMNMAIMFFFYCYGGEKFIHMNHNISEAVYDTPWYKQSIKLRKLIVIFLIQTQRPFQLSAFRMYTVRLNFFLLVVRTVYQALNVLIVILSK